MRRIEAFRAAHPEHPIVDVQYADLVTDPAATVASIYRAVGDELDDAGAKADRRVRRRPSAAASSAPTATTCPSTASTPAPSPSASPTTPTATPSPANTDHAAKRTCVEVAGYVRNFDARTERGVQRVRVRGRWRMPVWRLLRVHSMSPAGSMVAKRDEELVVHHPHLQAGEAGAEAEVQPVAEAEVQVGVARDVERVGGGEGELVAIGRALPHHDLLARGDGVTAELDGLGGGAALRR